MPWPPKQQAAIFLSIQRSKGTAAARRFMHRHGVGGKKRKKRRHAHAGR